MEVDASCDESPVAKIVVCDLCEMAFDYAPSAMMTPVFSLTCTECDAGMEIETEGQARREGWTKIKPAFDLPMANSCGLCPACRAVAND